MHLVKGEGGGRIKDEEKEMREGREDWRVH